MNNIVIKGRLTRDPELKEYSNSKGDGKLCNISVAVNRSYGEETDFFNCTAFGKLAEIINTHFEKGREIVINGEMQCQPYEVDGHKRYPWKLKINTFDFCGSKSTSNSDVPSAAPTDSFENIDEDVPF